VTPLTLYSYLPVPREIPFGFRLIVFRHTPLRYGPRVYAAFLGMN
jgi:hypothetical protein